MLRGVYELNSVINIVQIMSNLETTKSSLVLVGFLTLVANPDSIVDAWVEADLHLLRSMGGEDVFVSRTLHDSFYYFTFVHKRISLSSFIIFHVFCSRGPLFFIIRFHIESNFPTMIIFIVEYNICTTKYIIIKLYIP